MFSFEGLSTIVEISQISYKEMQSFSLQVVTAVTGRMQHDHNERTILKLDDRRTTTAMKDLKRVEPSSFIRSKDSNLVTLPTNTSPPAHPPSSSS